jgi:hypothetical protein
VAVAAALLVAGLAGTSVPASASTAPLLPIHRPQVLEASSGEAAGTHVVLTSKTVVISPSIVSSSLSSVSGNGATYTFSHDNGPLAQLAPGKVMLLEGRDAAVVTTLEHSGGKLIVGAVPASLGDVVQSGQIDVSGPPDAAGAVGAQLDTAPPPPAPKSAGYVVFGGGTAPSRSASPGPVYNDSNTFAYQGTTGGFTYKVGFTGKSDGLHATGDFCYQLVGSASGSSCGNGLSINVTLDGVFTWSNEDLKIGVAHSAVSSGGFSLSGMTSQITLNYTVLRGDEPKIGADPPVLKIPFAFEAPLCGTPLGCAGLPLYSKFELAILIKLGISSKNSTIQGGVTATVTGSGSITKSGLGVTGTATNAHVKGSFTPGTALTPGAAGVEVALQNKFGVGLGIKNINALYYISAITSVGETTGSAVAGQMCKSYVGNFFITGNAEAQLFGFTVASPAKTLWKSKPVSYKQPPC